MVQMLDRLKRYVRMRRMQVRNANTMSATDPIRRDLDRFVAVCMACHRFNGEGEGEQGPDLARPMNPVDYFQPAALRKYLRNPSSVRSWPEQKMPAFDEAKFFEPINSIRHSSTGHETLWQ